MNAQIRITGMDALKVFVSLLTIYSIHYGSTKVYNTLCIPDGASGYIQGFFTTASPWCRFFLDLMKTSENQYSSAILVGVSYFIMKILNKNLNEIPTPPTVAQ